MNVAQLQLALGRLTSPAAAEKPDLAGYEAQGGLPGWAGGSCAPRAWSLAGAQASAGRAVAGGPPWLGAPASAGAVVLGAGLSPKQLPRKRRGPPRRWGK